MKAMKRCGLLTAATALAGAMLALASPAWAAFPGDNGRIAFTKVPTTFQNQEIWAVDADGSNLTNLSNNPALDTHAAWSADGTKIAFTSARDGNTEIYSMNADGSNPVRLTNSAGEDSVPAWSADGTRIAFSSNRNGNYEIYAMNADGTEQTNLSNNPAVDLHPAWSPDGTEIAFESTRAGNYEIHKMKADGSDSTNLSNNLRTEAEPDWSPDGTKITFRSQRDNDNEIYTMNATDGSDPRNLSNDLGMIDYWPSWQPLELDRTAPLVSRVEPRENATGIGPGTNVSASFSEAMMEDSIDTDTVRIFKAGEDSARKATVTYDEATNKATLDPSAGLRRGQRYRVVVNRGARDEAGNRLDQDQDPSNGHQKKVWRFTVMN
jgi:TolB protein